MSVEDITVGSILKTLSQELKLTLLEQEALGQIALAHAKVLTGLVSGEEDPLSEEREAYAAQGISYYLLDYLDDFLEECQIVGLMQLVASGQTRNAQKLEQEIRKTLSKQPDMNIAAKRVSHIRAGGTP